MNFRFKSTVLAVCCLGVAVAYPMNQETCACLDEKSVSRSIIFDAGSTGTRIHLFVTHIDGRAEKPSDYKTKTIDGKKLLPLSGVSDTKDSMTNMLNEIKEAIDDLIAKTDESNLPKSCYCNTEITLLATAGLRSIDQILAEKILRNIRNMFKKSLPFKLSMPLKQVAILSGEDEALDSWITVNFLSKTLDSGLSNDTVSSLEMGGASLQFAAALDVPKSNKYHNYNILGREFSFKLISYLGAGRNAARLGFKNHSSCMDSRMQAKMKFNGKDYFFTGESIISPAECYQEALDMVHEFYFSDPELRLALSQNFKFLGISSFFHLANDASKFDKMCKGSNQVICVINYRNLNIAINKVCSTSRDTLANLELYEPNLLCMDLNYLKALLFEGFRFDKQRFRLRAPNKISGQKISWPLGHALRLAQCQLKGEADCSILPI